MYFQNILNILLQRKRVNFRDIKYLKTFSEKRYHGDIPNMCCLLCNLNYTYKVSCVVSLCKLVLPYLRFRYTGHRSHIPHKVFYWLKIIGKQIFEGSEVKKNFAKKPHWWIAFFAFQQWNKHKKSENIVVMNFGYKIFQMPYNIIRVQFTIACI